MKISKWKVLLISLVFGLGFSTTAYAEENDAEEDSGTVDELPDLSGHWRAEVVTTAITGIPILGDVITTSKSELAIEINQDGPILEVRTKTCTIDVDSNRRRVSTTIPDAFVASIPETTRRGVLRSSNDGVELLLPVFWEVQGARMEQPSQDEMPEDDDDPRVFDQDGDGNKGLTIKVDGTISGEVYIVQRGWDEWRAAINGEDEIRGEVRWDGEQTILGASSRLLRRQPKSEPDENQENNHFRMRRVAEPAECRR